MIGYRIKFKNIISELYIPQKQNGKVIIFLPGLPSFLGKNDVTKNLVNTEYVVFQPYYSGSFDSLGDFSPQNCIKDIDIFIKMASQKKHKELYFDKELTINTREIILFGTSYGSSIAVFGCNDNRVSKIVLFSPVLTYEQEKINNLGVNLDFEAQMEALNNLLRRGYPNTYRIKDKSSMRKSLLGSDKDFNPIDYLATKIDKPVFILHGENDSIPFELSKRLLEDANVNDNLCELVVIKNAGHSISYFSEDKTIKKLLKFLK